MARDGERVKLPKLTDEELSEREEQLGAAKANGTALVFADKQSMLDHLERSRTKA